MLELQTAYDEHYSACKPNDRHLGQDSNLTKGTWCEGLNVQDCTIHVSGIEEGSKVMMLRQGCTLRFPWTVWTVLLINLTSHPYTHKNPLKPLT